MRKLTQHLLPLMMLLLVSGCLGTDTTPTVRLTPDFPMPEAGVSEQIESLDDPAVDRWIINLLKLCAKLNPEKCEVGDD